MAPSTAPVPVVGPRGGGPSSRTPLGGTLLVMGSCLSLQFGAALATLLFPVLGSWGTSALRLGIAAVVLLLVIRPRIRSWNRRQWFAVVIFGLTLAGMNGFFYAAIERIPLGVAVSLEFLGPLALSAALSRRVRELVWVLLAVGAMTLFFADGMVGQEGLDPLGVTFALAAAAFWACYILASQRVGALVPGHGGLAIAIAIGALAILPFGAGAYPAVVAEPRLLLIAVCAAVLASVIPYSLEFAALRRLPRPVFSILLSLEPVFAVLAGWLLLDQTVSVLAMTAILLVVGASAGSAAGGGRSSPRRRRR